jgi:hypothetical protein
MKNESAVKKTVAVVIDSMADYHFSCDDFISELRRAIANMMTDVVNNKDKWESEDYNYWIDANREMWRICTPPTIG